MATKFTPKQGRYLAFIDHYIKIHGVPPAEADLLTYFRTSAPSVHQMVVTLERNNLISRTPGRARSIKILIPPEAIPDLKTGEVAMPTSRYAKVAAWIKEAGRSVELGYDPKTGTFARAFSEGVLVSSGGNSSDGVYALLAAVDAGIESQ